MATVDASTLFAIAQRYHGTRADTQNRVVSAIGPILQSTLDKYEITLILRAAHFLAQICHECQDFTAVEELGPPDYFLKYDGRYGNNEPGDGERYKGRGLIQLTFKDNYKTYGDLIGVDLIANPSLAAEPNNALLIACEFWNKLDLSALADNDDIITITKKINGGLNGIDQRRAYLSTAKNVLAGLAAKDVAGTIPDPQADPVLHRGDTIAEVSDVQRLLSAAGYAVTIDGSFGPGTEAAVKQMQTDNGLSPDGIVGPATWQKLRSN